jgi:hypothetical protein
VATLWMSGCQDEDDEVPEWERVLRIGIFG